VHLPDATQELADRTHVGRAWLQDCVEILRHRRQLIYYGPPGTGKTYIAQELARHVTDKENVKLVQFHPAYSYEDFFEGFRPRGESGGQMQGFSLKAGPLRRMVDKAAENPSSAYVLIIDEINRGNLPKIFGELYFLLEYRDQAIDLMYSPDSAEPFSLPKNIYVIGTMNTADRSIALVDTALRRRFAFLPLHPSEEPTSGILRRWLAGKGYDSNELMETIEAPGAQAMLPPRSNRKNQRKIDWHRYKARNLVERFFNWLKQFRRLATRHDKLDSRFNAFLQIACAMYRLECVM
jgi:5-methylcytosine-specific restriction protein B